MPRKSPVRDRLKQAQILQALARELGLHELAPGKRTSTKFEEEVLKYCSKTRADGSPGFDRKTIHNAMTGKNKTDARNFQLFLTAAEHLAKQRGIALPSKLTLNSLTRHAGDGGQTAAESMPPARLRSKKQTFSFPNVLKPKELSSAEDDLLGVWRAFRPSSKADRTHVFCEMAVFKRDPDTGVARLELIAKGGLAAKGSLMFTESAIVAMLEMPAAPSRRKSKSERKSPSRLETMTLSRASLDYGLLYGVRTRLSDATSEPLAYKCVLVRNEALDASMDSQTDLLHHVGEHDKDSYYFRKLEKILSQRPEASSFGSLRWDRETFLDHIDGFELKD